MVLCHDSSDVSRGQAWLWPAPPSRESMMSFEHFSLPDWTVYAVILKSHGQFFPPGYDWPHNWPHKSFEKILGNLSSIPLSGRNKALPSGNASFFFFFCQCILESPFLKISKGLWLYKSQWLTWAFWSSLSLISFDYILINFFWLPRHLALGTPCSTRYIHRYLWVRGPWLPS